MAKAASTLGLPMSPWAGGFSTEQQCRQRPSRPVQLAMIVVKSSAWVGDVGKIDNVV